MIRVREGARDDVEFVIDSIRGLAEYEKLTHEVEASAELLDRHLFGEPRYAELLIGEIDDSPAGYALFFHSYSTFLTRPGIFLEDLYVLPDLRGSGLGRALLGRIASLAVERQCGRVEWSVLDWNEPALAFYRSLGARPVDGWTTYRLVGEALDRFAASSDGR